MPPTRPLHDRLARPSSIFAAFLLALASALLPAAPAHAQADPRAKAVCDEAGAIVRDLTEISGMKLRRPVPCDFITRERVNEFLKKRIAEEISPEEVRAEELTLKKFGLVPQDFDLAGNTIELLTEQAAAFYDYEKKKLFITESTPSATQQPVLAHELSHALADQNFNLAKFIRQGRKSDDGATARLAVMEGQATWLMTEYLARQAGQSLRNSPELAALMSGLNDGAAAAQFPVFQNSPLYLRRSLIFPYTKGMLFQNAVIARDGNEAFGEVFRRAPASTQQIAHPEKYFASVTPTRPALPAADLRGYKPLVGGTLGELEHSILIEQYGGKQAADEIAPHWRGCMFELREDRKAKRVALLYSVEWDSEDAARRYFAVYKAALGRKWRRLSVESESGDAVAGTGDDGRFVLRRAGAIVTSIEGLP